MLDIRYIRDNPGLVQKNADQKGYKVSVKELLVVDDERRKLSQKADELRGRRNQIATQIKGGKPSPDLISEGKQLKTDLVDYDKKLSAIDDKFNLLINGLPNIVQPDVPIGSEDKSIVVKEWGGRPLENGAVNHLDYATSRDWVDFERGAKVASAKFYFLKGDLALLENAMTRFALDLVLKKGFTYLLVPALVNSRIATGTGFAPRTSDQSDEYYIEGEDLVLNATAEMPITGYHADEIIDEAKLPLRYVGYSASFRKEAGTYGKYTRGLFRVHQFNKLEMYIFATPEQSIAMHQEILAIEEEIWQAIGIPYHIINIATGDLGAPASKKYDIEYWSPVDQKYRELTSCSNCTDFQARNLNIRLRRQNGDVEFVHTLNGTAISLARALVAVIENFQTDGKLRVPDVLQPYMSDRKTL
jgi:seryl-tRNA synthetase